MFNQKILSEVLKAYKRDFAAGQWAAQKGKWQAVLHFKEHWDMDAPDFCQMFLRATDKTFRLLSSMNHYPRTMMKRFAQADPQAVREMFLGLFDESRDLAARCRMFESRSQDLLRQYGGSYKRHYQSLHAISTYLWLRYPDIYYIYKYAECRSAAQILQSDFSPRRAEDASRLQACFAWYEQLQEQLQKDEELVAMVNSALNGQCYRDPCLHILAVDVVFYISRVYARENGHAVLYGQASPEVPEIPLQKWQAMLLDPSVANGDALQALKCLLDYGAEACSAQLSTKYGQGEEFFQQAFEQLAKRVLASQGCLKESISQPGAGAVPAGVPKRPDLL